MTANLTQTSVWDSGYTAQVIITNEGDASAAGWVIEFDQPDGTQVSDHWSAARNQQGRHYTFINLDHNAVRPSPGRALADERMPPHPPRSGRAQLYVVSLT